MNRDSFSLVQQDLKSLENWGAEWQPRSWASRFVGRTSSNFAFKRKLIFLLDGVSRIALRVTAPGNRNIETFIMSGTGLWSGISLLAVCKVCGHVRGHYLLWPDCAPIVPSGAQWEVGCKEPHTAAHVCFPPWYVIVLPYMHQALALLEYPEGASAWLKE